MYTIAGKKYTGDELDEVVKAFQVRTGITNYSQAMTAMVNELNSDYKIDEYNRRVSYGETNTSGKSGARSYDTSKDFKDMIEINKEDRRDTTYQDGETMHDLCNQYAEKNSIDYGSSYSEIGYLLKHLKNDVDKTANYLRANGFQKINKMEFIEFD